MALSDLHKLQGRSIEILIVYYKWIIDCLNQLFNQFSNLTKGAFQLLINLYLVFTLVIGVTDRRVIKLRSYLFNPLLYLYTGIRAAFAAIAHEV